MGGEIPRYRCGVCVAALRSGIISVSPHRELFGVLFLRPGPASIPETGACEYQRLAVQSSSIDVGYFRVADGYPLFLVTC